MGERSDEYREEEWEGKRMMKERKGRRKGKKLVEELLLKLVWQMLEHGEPTPQTFNILHLYQCNDRCSVNTKLCKMAK